MFLATRMTHRPSRKAPALLSWLMALDANYRDRQKLQGLSEPLRRDIGLSEADIARELAKPVWNAPHHWMR